MKKRKPNMEPKYVIRRTVLSVLGIEAIFMTYLITFLYWFIR